MSHPTWPTLDSFYEEDERRRFSPERDFGKYWVMEVAPPYYRLSYLSATGEITMTDQDTGRVELLGWTPTEEGCAKMFKDWPKHSRGEPKSYYWCRKQVLNASGHRGRSEREHEARMGDEVDAALRDSVSGDRGTLF